MLAELVRLAYANPQNRETLLPVIRQVMGQDKTAGFTIGLSAAVPMPLRRFVALIVKMLASPIPGLANPSESRIRTFGFVVALLENSGYVKEARAVNNLLRASLVREPPALPGTPL